MVVIVPLLSIDMTPAEISSIYRLASIMEVPPSESKKYVKLSKDLMKDNIDDYLSTLKKYAIMVDELESNNTAI